MILVRELSALQESLPIRSAPELESSVHWTPSETVPIHRWFRYREGFSPNLFRHYGRSRHRLDPFCGCGTTLLESARSKIPSYGVDINPLATFVTRTKTTPYSKADRAEFVRTTKTITSRIRATKPATAPKYSLLPKIFQPEALETLLRLKTGVEEVESPDVKNLLLLAWISILERSSNVFKEGNGIKYRNKRRQPHSYATVPDDVWIPRYFGKDIPAFVLRLWSQKTLQIAEDLAAHPLHRDSTPDVRTGSCMDPAMLDFGQPVDLCIFSPPYANRFDYFESFKVELWMGGFVRSRETLLQLRHASMRNNLGASRGASSPPWAPLTPFLDAMDPSASSVGMGIRATLRGYFEDTRTLLRNLRSIVVKSGRVVIVVGNSAYAGSIVPTDVLVAKIGKEEGYRVKRIDVARHLHVSSQQRPKLGGLTRFMRESVVVLENPRCTNSH